MMATYKPVLLFSMIVAYLVGCAFWYEFGALGLTVDQDPISVIFGILAGWIARSAFLDPQPNQSGE